ncbi:F-box/LRR-repeat protein 2-like [Gigantopelta aegis]|uniref:F-box/LRR-repeat protein 2-like n=1 Tax=Gigantopelta aegis TaxID=1735272 RepID=UPI001B88AC69|nr:F-box/LRR-repeat protein 2-like [Gigantopelta aegis]XP_041348133.1 F-box/LRR-repeat protein 2-like [Gigantopelta aegis]
MTSTSAEEDMESNMQENSCDHRDTDFSNENAAEKFNLHKKVFVGNLGYRIQRKELASFFSKFGNVYKTHIVMDHIKHHSRGIAFVYFKRTEDADRALQATDDELVLDGRVLRVHPAEESKRTSFKRYQSLPNFDKNASDGESQAVREVENGNSKQTDVTVDSSTSPDHALMSSERVSMTLNDLCDELLVEIFSYLPIRDKAKIERVCHRWRNLALQTWATVKTLHFVNMFRHFGGLVDKMLNSILQRCGSSLRSLDLSASPRLLTDYAMDIIARYCPDLIKLDISGVAATNKSIQSLSTKCTKLKWVRLQRCFNVGEKGLWWLLHNCQNLEYLDINGNSRITGKCFHMLGQTLKTAVLSNCCSLTDVAITKLGEKCPDLNTLYIDSCVALTDVGIKTVCQKLSHLEFLAVGGSFPSVVNTESWLEMQHLTKLTYLSVSSNLDITDQVLTAVSNSCLSLRHVDISSCYRNVTDVGVQALSHLEHLEVLNISYLHLVTDESLYLVSLNGRLQKLTARACSKITDKGVESLAERCENLTHLDLSGCLYISNMALKAFIHSHQNQQLDLVLGGTSVVLQEVTVPAHIIISLHDRSVYHLRPDRELLLPEHNSDEDAEENDYEDRPLQNRAYMPAGIEEIEDPWLEEETGLFSDLRDDYLLGDDPLAEEAWDLT